jgi:hypothetical protein
MNMLIITLIALCALFIILSLKPKNHFLKKVQEMSRPQRARLLVHTTLLRLAQENNPITTQFAQMFMHPSNFSPAMCKDTYYSLLDQIVEFKKERKVSDGHIKKLGLKNGIPELVYIEDGLCVWLQTVGTNCSMAKFAEVKALWSSLREGMPLIPDILEEMKEEHQLSMRLGINTNFLQGFSAEEVLIKAEEHPHF